MKAIALLTLTAVLLTPILAKAPKPPKAIPPNASRKLVSAYKTKLFESLGNLSTKKPAATLPIVSLSKKKLGRGWTPNWQTSKDGKTLCVRYMPKSDKRLGHGQAIIYVSIHPFNGKLKDAPSLQDDAAGIEFGVIRYNPQKWQSREIPALNLKVRTYMDAASGGADNEMNSTEPFSFKAKDGKTYWIVVDAESGYHKSKGMSLQKALNALVFP